MEPLDVFHWHRYHCQSLKNSRCAPVFEDLPLFCMDYLEIPLGWALAAKYFSTPAAPRHCGGMTVFWQTFVHPGKTIPWIDEFDRRLSAVLVIPAVFQALFACRSDLVFVESDMTSLIRNVRSVRKGRSAFERTQIGQLEYELYEHRCLNALKSLFVPCFSICSLPQMVAENEPFPGSSLFPRSDMLQFIKKRALSSILRRLTLDALMAFFANRVFCAVQPSAFVSESHLSLENVKSRIFEAMEEVISACARLTALYVSFLLLVLLRHNTVDMVGAFGTAEAYIQYLGTTQSVFSFDSIAKRIPSPDAIGRDCLALC